MSEGNHPHVEQAGYISPPAKDEKVDSLLAQAEEAKEEGLLPATVFNDEDIYEAELWRIFAQEWIFIGHVSEIPEPGDYARRYIGTDPYIFVRDKDGEIQVLFDSCRHRGTKICRAETGNTSHFRCPYHGWTYKNDGTLQGIITLDDALVLLASELDKLATTVQGQSPRL
jgi:phenylpropionate dioxygenase-like ring-hydroxylating dioxygenase large terminal subunit